MEHLVETFARALVVDEDAVRVSRYSHGDTEVIEVDVSPRDRGRIIGRNGQTVSALRTLVDAIAERRGQQYELEIRE